MNEFSVSFEFTLADVPPDHRERYFDAIADALADDTRVDGDVAADLRSGAFEVCLTLAAASMTDAFVLGSAAARAAVHAAGIGSEEWEPLNEAIRRAVVEPVTV